MFGPQLEYQEEPVYLICWWKSAFKLPIRFGDDSSIVFGYFAWVWLTGIWNS